MATCAKCIKVYANEFKDCPHCSGKRGILGLLAILVIAGIAAWLAWSNSQTAASGNSSSGDDSVSAMSVTAPELAQAFQANEVAAQKKYGGKVLDVTGTTSGSILDFLDRPVIHLNGISEFLPVQAQFDKSFGDQLSKLSKGQKITVRCMSLTSIVSAPMLSDCSLPTAMAPALLSAATPDQGQPAPPPDQAGSPSDAPYQAQLAAPQEQAGSPSDAPDQAQLAAPQEQAGGEVSGLIQKEIEFNNLCRDGPGDNPRTKTYCDDRDKLVEQLKSKGWCYGTPAQIDADKEWQQCSL
jgi:hypothetical protein